MYPKSLQSQKPPKMYQKTHCVFLYTFWGVFCRGVDLISHFCVALCCSFQCKGVEFQLSCEHHVLSAWGSSRVGGSYHQGGCMNKGAFCCFGGPRKEGKKRGCANLSVLGTPKRVEEMKDAMPLLRLGDPIKGQEKSNGRCRPCCVGTPKMGEEMKAATDPPLYRRPQSRGRDEEATSLLHLCHRTCKTLGGGSSGLRKTYYLRVYKAGVGRGRN